MIVCYRVWKEFLQRRRKSCQLMWLYHELFDCTICTAVQLKHVAAAADFVDC